MDNDKIGCTNHRHSRTLLCCRCADFIVFETFSKSRKWRKLCKRRLSWMPVKHHALSLSLCLSQFMRHNPNEPNKKAFVSGAFSSIIIINHKFLFHPHKTTIHYSTNRWIKTWYIVLVRWIGFFFVVKVIFSFLFE